MSAVDLEEAFNATGLAMTTAECDLDRLRRAWRNHPTPASERAYRLASKAAHDARSAYLAAKTALLEADLAADEEAALEAAHWRAATQ